MCVEVACASSSELMVDRYTQILHYVYLWQKFWEAEGVGHKLSVLFKGPGWTPGKPRMGCIEDIPQVRARYVTDIKYRNLPINRPWALEFTGQKTGLGVYTEKQFVRITHIYTDHRIIKKRGGRLLGRIWYMHSSVCARQLIMCGTGST